MTGNQTRSNGLLWQLNGNLEKSLGNALARFRKRFGKDPEIIALCSRDEHGIKVFEDINVIQDPSQQDGHAWLEAGK